jgi:hypothetical protein
VTRPERTWLCEPPPGVDVEPLTVQAVNRGHAALVLGRLLPERWQHAAVQFRFTVLPTCPGVSGPVCGAERATGDVYCDGCRAELNSMPAEPIRPGWVRAKVYDVHVHVDVDA